MGGRAAVSVALVVWTALVLGASLSASWAWAALALAAPLAWLTCRAPDRTGTVALWLALILVAAARGASQHRLLDSERHSLGDCVAPRRVEARVLEPPRREAGEPLATLASLSGWPALAAGARLRVRLPEGCGAEWGDRLELFTRLEIPARATNPGGFDARAAADAGSIAARGRAFTALVAPATGLEAWPRATLARWRRALEASFARGLSPEARELVAPLVVGDRTALSTDLAAAFRASGLVYLLVLSGLHVAWLASLARGLAALFGGGVRARAIAGALCACLVAGIAGPSPPLMRAALGELLSAAAKLARRALDPVQSLAVSALIMMMLAPGWALDLGFQLSFCATFGLIAFRPWWIERAGHWRPLMALVAPTLSAQLAAAPLLIAQFHALSWTGTLANLIAVPTCGLLLIAAWLAGLLDAVAPGSARLLFDACEILSAALGAIANLAARLPAALIATGSESGIAACAALGTVLLALALASPRALDARARPTSRARAAGAGLGATALACAALLIATARPLAPPPGRWWLVVLDVGQGDSLALGFEDAWWLVDTGPRSPHYDAGEAVVLPFLRWACVRELGTMALTHDDGDHTGGARAVSHAMRVRRTIASPPLPGVPGPSVRFHASTVARGDRLRAEPRVQVLWPPRPDASRSASAIAEIARLGDNGAAMVLEVGEGDARALLLADAPAQVEDSLSVAPGVAVLKVGHHGSATSSGSRFLARVEARSAAISVGLHNPFGHPDPSVVARLRATCGEVHRTDLEGALWFELGPGGGRLLDWRIEAQRGQAPAPSPRRVPAP